MNARTQDYRGSTMTELSNDSMLNAQWARVRGRLRAEFGEATFRSWLKPLNLAGKRGPDLRVSVPSRFMRDWVATHYADRLKALWSSENPEIRTVEVIVDAHRPVPELELDANALEEDAPVAMSPVPATPVREDDSVESVSAPLDPRLTFENFVVGKSNELAHAAALRVAEADSVPFNPLFLYGGVGLGKTHLMHAIAWHIRSQAPGRKVIYLSAEKFMYQFIRALRFRSTMDFKEQFRSVDLLMIDDVQFISGKDSTQEEFFHTFNALVDQNRQVV